ncbi:nuclear transport factor 2 family protein [Frankia sp. AgB1.9]|uniref:nuclear transport factor 2 family protein n=1 Tax=unclassified Frankia TaxID=2632575 RepID=UPI0019331A1B|nr:MULTISPECIES: nuclear transport factor 2 family protein [unclassified Frankia]MBL7488224.1 nuclear transport factor 2 family protein [Frankia sp. AgW1.1]MBL7548133.1 nuclear transport factor 2 family protein [Frankia sp. AgB1.9]MBL7620359.1 nuclear transport factor 2 family protein [Frankia sp. AgB1.8]
MSTAAEQTRAEVGVDSADAVAVVKEMARRFQSGDFAGARALMHPEIRVQQPASLPHGGWHTGQDGMAAMNVEAGAHWDRAIVDPRITGSGATAVQITTQTWTAKATGRVATVDVVELFTVADGTIREIRVFQQDTHLLLGTLDN